MKKLTLLITFMIIVFFGICENPIVTTPIKQQVKITILDENGEKLVGVKDEITKTYSNLKGDLQIEKGNSIDLQFISYNSLSIHEVCKDTTIILKEVKEIE
jgi:hypothetical protein